MNELQINIEDLTQEQKDFIAQYQRIHAHLISLQEQMKSLQDEAETTIKELETLRNKENKIFKDGKK